MDPAWHKMAHAGPQDAFQMNQDDPKLAQSERKRALHTTIIFGLVV